MGPSREGLSCSHGPLEGEISQIQGPQGKAGTPLHSENVSAEPLSGHKPQRDRLPGWWWQNDSKKTRAATSLTSGQKRVSSLRTLLSCLSGAEDKHVLG